MASSGRGGLSFGQFFALAVAFTVASGLVFVFGMWVGKDLAERRLAQEERVVRRPVIRATPAMAARDPDITFYDRLRPTPTVLSAASRIEPPATLLGEAQRARPGATPPQPRTPRRKKVVPETREMPEEWADAGWTVQVTATTDRLSAEATVARLRAKGYDAYVVQAPMRGQTWYRVRVGRFESREAAVAMERRLRSAEGFAGAYAAPR